jgi:very-short-patch-repair endonuclease
MTQTTWAAILFLIAILVMMVVMISRKITGYEVWPFYAKKPLTQPEQILYHRIVKSLPECIVLAQVQVSRVLGVKKGFRFHEWNNRINRLSLDYVICSKDSTVIAAIELDDSSHNRQERQETDRRKERALKSAGITLIRWSVKSLPNEQEIRAILKKQNPTEAEGRQEPTL